MRRGYYQSRRHRRAIVLRLRLRGTAIGSRLVTARVALATAAEFPDLDDDGPALLAALADQGVHAEPAVWTDPGVDCSAL